MDSGEFRVTGLAYADGESAPSTDAVGAPESEREGRSFRAAHVAVNLVLVLVIALFGWVAWQEVFSAMPDVDTIQGALVGTPHADALTETRIEGKDAVLVYDLTGQSYFDEQQRYAGEFEQAARVVLDDFRRVQRVRVTIVQGTERYEGLSVTDGFGKILELF